MKRWMGRLGWAVAAGLVLSCGGSDGGAADAVVDGVDTSDQNDTVADVVTDSAQPPTDTLVDTAAPTDTSGQGGFGDPCIDNADCGCGFCVPGPDSKLCTCPCTDDCPEGFECRALDPFDTDIVFVCLPVMPNECALDSDCDDGLSCTQDGCVAGQCENTPDAGTCAIGGVCYATGAANPVNGCEACVDGVDGKGWSARSCDDDNPCTTDSCDALTGCANTALDDGTDCDDGDPCTQDTTCDGGQCVGECGCLNAADCQEEPGDCRVWTCVNYECVAAPDTAQDGEACDDGAYCTEATTCTAGVCGGGTARDCSGFTDAACMQGACDEAFDACVAEAVPDGSACSDGDICTTGDLCDSGECLATPKDCSGLTTVCADGVCNSDTGQCEAQINAGQACSDGEACTIEDACDAAGLCQGAWDEANCGCTDDAGCTALTDACNVGRCDVSANTCFKAPTVGVMCNDGNACSHTDVCQADGRCAGEAYVCQAALSCQSSDCDGEGGCDDSLLANFCAIDDACWGSGQVNPGNACQHCDPALSTTAWSSVADGSACDADNNGCTVGDSCQAGVCQAGGAAACEDDGLACTDQVCGSTGPDTFSCSVVANGQGCFIDGTCYAQNAQRPGNQCQRCAQVANPTGWSDRAAGAACDADGSGCTLGDSCQAGQCVIGTAPDCTDAFSCTADDCVSTGANTYECDNSVNGGSCLIGGTCVGLGVDDPNNTCRECAASNPTAWTNKGSGTACGDASDTDCTDPDTCNGSGVCEPNHASATTSCDDGDACTVGGTCDGDGVCGVGGAIDCDDGLDCTTDSCSGGECVFTVMPGFCVIGDVCVSHGTDNPANACEECNAGSPSAYSPKAVGATCDDGDACTENDTCDGAGACAAGPLKDCNDGKACTSDTCSGGICSNVVDNGFCLIGANCRSHGDPHPNNDCRECNADSSSAWSNKAVGAFCGDSTDTTCNARDTCNGAGQCQSNFAGTNVSCEDGDGCTVGDTCDGAGGCSAGGPKNCSDGKPCTDDVCNGGICSNPIQDGRCLISGTCYENGDAPAGPLCRVCRPNVIQTSWAYANAGVPCGDQTSSTCDNPDTCDSNGICQANYVSATTSCSDGDACTVGDTCNGSGACTPGSPMNCSDGKACTDDVCTDGTCSNPIQNGFCLISGTCRANGFDDPTNDCRECISNSNPTAYSNKGSGAACGDPTNTTCNAADTCNGAGTCLDNYAAKTVTCNDGDGCTVGDKCSGSGSCNPGPPKDCNDNLTCTTDSCSGGVCSNVLQDDKCLIAGVCYNDGQRRTGVGCDACDPETPTIWGNAPTGAFCINQFLCEGFCTSTGVCNGPGGGGTQCF